MNRATIVRRCTAARVPAAGVPRRLGAPNNSDREICRAHNKIASAAQESLAFYLHSLGIAINQRDERWRNLTKGAARIRTGE